MNILFLVSHYYYAQKMSRCRFHQMEAVGRHDGVQVRVWGRGFPAYCDQETVWANIRRHFGATAFDLLHVYRPEDHHGLASCPLPKVIDYNEAWDRKAVVREILRHDIGLVIFHHRNDWQAFQAKPRLARARQLVHIPHAAEQSIFVPAARPWAERSLPVLLTGALRRDMYPLRARCADLILAGKIPGEIRQHPGYRTAGTAETCDQFVDYARHLGRSRIALVLGITHDYALAKYPEAAMAGCLLVGDIPEELEPTLGRHMVPLQTEMSDTQIGDTLAWWLAHDAEAQARAAASQQLALAQFTMEHYAAHYVRVARAFLHNACRPRRGMAAHLLRLLCPGAVHGSWIPRQYSAGK